MNRVVSCALLASTTLTACMSWQVQPVSPEQVVTTERPTTVRVQRKDGAQFVMADPRIAGDTLLGSVDGKPARIALSDISNVAVKRDDGTRTAAIIIGVVVVPIVILIAALCGSGGCSGGS
jgi:hypothetical protein